MIKKPMLAAKFDKDPNIALLQMKALRFPILGAPKIDGIRAHSEDGGLYSRKNILIPNLYTQSKFGLFELQHADGELVEGKPNSEGTFNRTQSAVMSVDGEPNVSLYVFDYTAQLATPFEHRIMNTFGMALVPHVKLVEQTLIKNLDELFAYEEEKVLDGWEGVMLRAIRSPYKQGRSTLNEGWLIKMKRFEHSEAVILGAYEQETNLNEAKINEVGSSKRSSHKANKLANGHLGGFNVRDIHTGVEFNVGNLSGVTKEERFRLWQQLQVSGLDSLNGKLIRYKYFPVGVKDKPRHPVLDGFRSPIDL